MYGSFRLSADETDGRLLEGLRFYARDVQREAPYVPPFHSCSHHADICHNDAVVSCRYVWMFGVVGVLHSIVNARRNSRRYFEALLLGVFLFYLIFFHALANMELEGRPDLVEVLLFFRCFTAHTVSFCSAGNPAFLDDACGHNVRVHRSRIFYLRQCSQSFAECIASICICCRCCSYPPIILGNGSKFEHLFIRIRARSPCAAPAQCSGACDD